MLHRTNWVQAAPVGAKDSHQFRAGRFQRAQSLPNAVGDGIYFSLEIKHLEMQVEGKP